MPTGGLHRASATAVGLQEPRSGTKQKYAGRRRTGMRRPRHPPNSPTTVIDTVTQTAAPSVIQMPTLAMSRMEK